MNLHISIGTTPVWQRLAIAATLAGAVTVVTGCAVGGSGQGDHANQWSQVVPGSDGLYAHRGEELVRLDGDAEWERKTWGQRAGLAPGSEFVIRDPAIAELSGAAAEAITLRKVAWVRSAVTQTGDITPAEGGKWRNVPLSSLAVPFETDGRAESNPAVIRIRPKRPLEPGLYAIQLDTGDSERKARFGVAWRDTDKQAYAASVCVDRYLGPQTTYHPCRTQTVAGGDPLQIYLVEPTTRAVGAGRSMVISGVIVNDSDRPQAIPLLTAEIRSSDSRPLTRWRFKAASTRLAPGESTSFRTEVGDTPRKAHSVNVNFTSAQVAN